MKKGVSVIGMVAGLVLVLILITVVGITSIESIGKSAKGALAGGGCGFLTQTADPSSQGYCFVSESCTTIAKIEQDEKCPEGFKDDGDTCTPEPQTGISWQTSLSVECEKPNPTCCRTVEEKNPVLT